MKIWWTECFNRLRSVGYFVTEDGRVINVPIDWTHNFLSEGAEKQIDWIPKRNIKYYK